MARHGLTSCLKILNGAGFAARGDHWIASVNMQAKRKYSTARQVGLLDSGTPRGSDDQREAIAPTIDWKTLSPSVHPSSGSAERSGCGIMPRTLPPELQIPAMLSSEPLGLAAEVTSPAGVEYRNTMRFSRRSSSKVAESQK